MKFMQRIEQHEPSGGGCWGGFPPDYEWIFRRKQAELMRNGLSFFWGVANAVKAVETFRDEGMYPVWGGR